MKKFLALILLLIAGVFSAGLYFDHQFEPAERPGFGITFSDKFAASLGFDPMHVYVDMLADLKPKKIRLIAYWDQIEKVQGKFDFNTLDRMLIEAEKRNVEVMMTVGRKVPRWPECHQPEWFGKLDSGKQEEALLNMLGKTVGHLKQYRAIKMWQVENEPYFVFGINCPLQDPLLVKKEVETVKSIDSRPVVLTGSGEQGHWNQLSTSGADIVGVTMYRTVYNDRWGYYKYPVGPWFYRMKAGYLQKMENKPVIGVELQAEPWLLSGIFNTKVEDQKVLMNPKVFQEHVDYAKKVGFTDNYIWGVEWWYWMAKKQNDWGMWTAAKNLFAESE